VVPAAFYFVNYILLKRKSPVCKLIAAVSALGVLLSLCGGFFIHDEYSLIAFMLFTPCFYLCFPCVYTENADLLFKECLFPQLVAIFRRIRGTHDKTASTSEDFGVESVHELPHVLMPAPMPVNASDAEELPMPQIGIDAEAEKSTIKVSERVADYRS
jgi:hypothetical protein